MSELPVSVGDLVFLGVMLLSGILALMRGFVREVVTIIQWAAAAFVALYLFPVTEPTFLDLMPGKPAADSPMGLIASGSAFLVVFFVTLFMLSLIFARVLEKFGKGEPGAFDGTFGFVFGLGRGFLLICLAFLAIDFAFQPQQVPPAFAQAKMMPAVKDTNNFLRTLGPGSSDKNGKKEKENAQKKKNDNGKTGYSEEERDAIDKLFEQSSDDG